MKRALVSVAILFVLTCGARPAHAQSIPFINIDTFALELCPQSICGAAIFVGVLHGQVGLNPHAIGTFSVAITHDPLPPNEGDVAEITGGVFEFRIGLRRIRGVVLPRVSGIRNNGDNTFGIRAVLAITSGGAGILIHEGVLNHNVFPPTEIGRVQ
jgi:hypothetical protein